MSWLKRLTISGIYSRVMLSNPATIRAIISANFGSLDNELAGGLTQSSPSFNFVLEKAVATKFGGCTYDKQYAKPRWWQSMLKLQPIN